MAPDRPIRVLFVTGMYPAPWHELHGPFVHESARALSELDVSVEVIRTVAWRPPIQLEGRRIVLPERTLDGVRARYVTVPYPPWAPVSGLRAVLMRPGVTRAIRAAHTKEPFDLLHAHQVIPIGHAALPSARKLGLPLVCTAHGSEIYFDARGGLCRRQAAQVIRASSQVVAVSHDLATQTARLSPGAKKVITVPNGVDLELFHPLGAEEARRELGLKDVPRLLYVGNLEAHKGVLELLRAFELVSMKRPEAELVYVGEGQLGRLLSALVGRFHLDKRVRLVGARPRAEVPLWMAASSLCVVPSRRESFGIVALEAMACARPVVASRVGGLPELIEDGVTGRLTPPHDPLSLAAAIDDLLADRAKATRLGEAARRWVLDANLTWKDHAHRLLAVYREVLGTAGGAG